MNLLDAGVLPDVQAQGDDREVHLDAVGVAGLSIPVSVLGPDGASQRTIADLEMTVAVPESVRGTHMSRFVEAAASLPALTPGVVLDFARTLTTRLESSTAQVRMSFPLFIEREAPSTRKAAPHRYDASIRTRVDPSGARSWIGVSVPVKSLCPCSREISDYGAHSQRGIVDLEVESPGWDGGTGIWPQELFCFADEAGSAQIYPLLKRPDERAVTMTAYDNPAFVEDIARNVIVGVRGDERCTSWSVTVTNQESIHAHDAIARVSGRR